MLCCMSYHLLCTYKHTGMPLPLLHVHTQHLHAEHLPINEHIVWLAEAEAPCQVYTSEESLASSPHVQQTVSQQHAVCISLLSVHLTCILLLYSGCPPHHQHLSFYWLCNQSLQASMCLCNTSSYAVTVAVCNCVPSQCDKIFLYTYTHTDMDRQHGQ